MSDNFLFEFQAVIMAGGRGSRMGQLVQGKPKCLLMVANKPLVQYPLELLIRSGIKETILVVLDNEEDQIKSLIHRLNLDILIFFFSIPHADDYATADSLRMMKDRIHKDCLVLTCDLVSDINLFRFIQMYRTTKATFCCLLNAGQTQDKDDLTPARKLAKNQEFDYIGLDLDYGQKSRLVFFEPDVIFTDSSIPFKQSFFEKCSHFEMSTKLHDVHVYVFKHWLLDYLDHKSKIKSLKADLVPSLIRKQFRNSRNKQKKDVLANEQDHSRNLKDSVKQMFDFIVVSKLDQFLNQSDNFDNNTEVVNQYPNSLVKCYALVMNSSQDDSYCIRVNNWLTFCEANRIVLKRREQEMNKSITIKSESIKSHVDCSSWLGHATSVGERCIIKKSVLGANCKIGNRCKLTNCIILDNVTIEDDSVLQGTIVCVDVKIGKNVQIKECIVGPRQKISPSAICLSESLTEEILDDDFKFFQH